MPKRILVIEDELDYRILLESTLKDGGYEVQLAARGGQGIDIVEKDRPDMVLLDLNLPDTTGYEVCKRLRQGDRSGRIPIIMVTMQSDLPDIVKGMRLGADDYISKPFDPEEVLARVAALFRLSGDKT